jgi:cobalamin biosynthesis protein CobT
MADVPNNSPSNAAVPSFLQILQLGGQLAYAELTIQLHTEQISSLQQENVELKQLIHMIQQGQASEKRVDELRPKRRSSVRGLPRRKRRHTGADGTFSDDVEDDSEELEQHAEEEQEEDELVRRLEEEGEENEVTDATEYETDAEEEFAKEEAESSAVDTTDSGADTESDGSYSSSE